MGVMNVALPDMLTKWNASKDIATGHRSASATRTPLAPIKKKKKWAQFFPVIVELEELRGVQLQKQITIQGTVLVSAETRNDQSIARASCASYPDETYNVLRFPQA